jgi:hypothetical protein
VNPTGQGVYHKLAHRLANQCYETLANASD